MVKYVQGDLFDTNCDIIAHGVNCRNAFGSGVAGLMAQKYPKAKSMYHEKFEQEGWWLGDVQYVMQRDGKFVANCATQDDFGYNGAPNADYGAIRKCMESVKYFAVFKNLSVAIPKIGAGLAGGDWNVIERILDEVFNDYDVTVYYL